MAYDFVRIGIGIVVFIAVWVSISVITKKHGKSILIASFSGVIAFALLLLLPFENIFGGFTSVEKIYEYRHHEKLATYTECDEGVLCIGKKDEANTVYYSFFKRDGKYLIPRLGEEGVSFRSSNYGIFIVLKCKTETLIMTRVSETTYNGEPFVDCGSGYLKFVVSNEKFSFSEIKSKGEEIHFY